MSAKQVREILSGGCGESSVGATVYDSIVRELHAADTLSTGASISSYSHRESGDLMVCVRRLDMSTPLPEGFGRIV